jgi:hypothetical protein
MPCTVWDTIPRLNNKERVILRVCLTLTDMTGANTRRLVHVRAHRCTHTHRCQVLCVRPWNKHTHARARVRIHIHTQVSVPGTNTRMRAHTHTQTHTGPKACVSAPVSSHEQESSHSGHIGSHGSAATFASGTSAHSSVSSRKLRAPDNSSFLHHLHFSSKELVDLIAHIFHA